MSSGLEVTYMTDVLPLGLDSVANGLIILCLQLVFNISFGASCFKMYTIQFWHPKSGQNNKISTTVHTLMFWCILRMLSFYK